MDIVKVFVRDNCPKCPSAKKLYGDLLHGPAGEIAVIQAFNVDQPVGLAEASMYMIQGTPAIMLCDRNEEIVREWRSDMPAAGEIESLLNKRAYERVEQHVPAP